MDEPAPPPLPESEPSPPPIPKSEAIPPDLPKTEQPVTPPLPVSRKPIGRKWVTLSGLLLATGAALAFGYMARHELQSLISELKATFVTGIDEHTRVAGTNSEPVPETDEASGVGADLTPEDPLSLNTTERYWSEAEANGVEQIEEVASIPPDEDISRVATESNTTRNVTESTTDRQMIVEVLRGHNKSVTAVTITSDGKRAFSGSADSSVIAWSVHSGDILWESDDFHSSIACVRLSIDERRLFVCDHHSFFVIDPIDGSIRKMRPLPIDVVDVELSANAERALLLPSVQDGKHPALLTSPIASNTIRRLHRVHGISSGTISEDGSVVVFGGYHLSIFNPITSAVRNDLVSQWGYFGGMDISPDNKFLATGSIKLYEDRQNKIGNRLVRLWDLRTGSEIANHQEHRGWINAVVFIRDGSQILSAGGGSPEFYAGRGPNSDNALRIWEISEDRIIWTGTGHSAAVTCLAVTGDSRIAISGSHDRTARIWHLPESD